MIRAVLLALVFALGVVTTAAEARGFLFASDRGKRDCPDIGPEDRDWISYRKRFIGPDGRVVDTANRAISHSEGQGYAMLLAVAHQDRPTFTRIWQWTRENLAVREDALLVWRWDPLSTPPITDRNNATDGDLLVAWALLEAHDRWGNPDDRADARRIAEAIHAKATVATPFGRVLLPGVDGFGPDAQVDGPVVNPSYWVFPALERLETSMPDIEWRALIASGLGLIRAGRFGPRKLPSEWVSIADARIQPAANFDRVFGYNAIRIPLYLAMMRSPPTELLKGYGALWDPGTNIGPAIIDIDSGLAREPMNSTGFRRVLALADFVAHQRPVPEHRFRSPDLHYYPATLGLLANIVLRERYLKCP